MQLAGRREQARRRGARRSRRTPAGRRAAGRAGRGSPSACTTGPSGQRLARARRPRRSRPCRRSRTTRSRRSAARRPPSRRTGATSRTTIVSSGWLSVRRVAAARSRRPRGRRSGPRSAGSRPRARPRGPGVRIVTATATGSCSRAGGADLERRLADDPVVADLERLAADGHDPAGGDVAGRRGASVSRQARSVGPATDRAHHWQHAGCSSTRASARSGRRAGPRPRDDRPRRPAATRAGLLRRRRRRRPRSSTRRSTTSRRRRRPADLARVRDIASAPGGDASSSTAGTRTGRGSPGSAATAGEPCWSPATAAGHAAVVAALRAKYPQYASHALEDRPTHPRSTSRIASRAGGRTAGPSDQGTRAVRPGRSSASSGPGLPRRRRRSRRAAAAMRRRPRRSPRRTRRRCAPRACDSR